jgi:hypothetical protein
MQMQGGFNPMFQTGAPQGWQGTPGEITDMGGGRISVGASQPANLIQAVKQYNDLIAQGSQYGINENLYSSPSAYQGAIYAAQEQERQRQQAAQYAAMQQAGQIKPTLPQIGQPAQGPSAAQSWWAGNNPQQVKSLLPTQSPQSGATGTQGGTTQNNASSLADNLRLIRERFATLGRSGSQEEYLALQEAMNQYGQMTQAPSQSSGVNPYKIFH